MRTPSRPSSSLEAKSGASRMPNENDSRPATRKDLDDLRDLTRLDLNELRNKLRQELRGDLNALRDELVEKMRDMQTEVLRAFHDWARPVDIKLRAIPPMDERLGLIEERVSRLERANKHP